MTKKIEDIKLNIDIDATQAQRSIELLSKTLCNLIDKCEGTVNKQPHIRIEFDDIDDTPRVFVDGVEQQGLHRVELNWKSDSTVGVRYRIDYMDSLGRLYGIGQGK